MAVFIDTPWPRPTPAEGSNCNSRIPFPKGGVAGLHKRSAEDKGGYCGRERQSLLGKAWFPCFARSACRKIYDLYGASELSSSRPGQHSGKRLGCSFHRALTVLQGSGRGFCMTVPAKSKLCWPGGMSRLMNWKNIGRTFVAGELLAWSGLAYGSPARAN